MKNLQISFFSRLFGNNLALILLLILQGIGLEGFGQAECAHDFSVDYYKNNLPNFSTLMSNRVNFMNQWISTHSNINGYVEALNPINQGSHVIPVMVHIVRATPANDPNEPYITEDQVHSQINALNAYFSGAGISNVNTQIQFCLVNNNASNAGNWDLNEPGILRYDNNPLANNLLTVASANALAAGTNTCPYDEVLNIWVVRSIDGNNSGVRGYSPLPISPQANLYPGIQLDGVVVTAAVFGSNTYSNPAQTFPLVPNYPPNPWDLFTRNQGKILAHEVGHYLNLFHTFQTNLVTNQSCVGVGASCSTDGDFICDTEPVLMPNNTYINGSPLPSTCSNPGSDDVGNFMYYADDITLDHFTQGQRNWMLAHLFNFRSDLITVSNLNKWGLIGNSIGCVNDGVFAAFDITGNHCVNTSLSFSPTVSTPLPNLAASWSWNFGDGGTATGSNPTHAYSNVGTYTITCTATDGNNTNTNTSTQVINIISCGLNPNYLHNSQWYFGNFVGYDFNAGGATPLVNVAPRNNNSILALEASTSYADNQGNVIFYTNGVNFWNANHVQINTNPIFTSCVFLTDPLTNVSHNTSSQLQGLITCPYPGHPNQYIIFSSPNAECNAQITNQMRYVILDMVTNSFSPVVTLNIPNMEIYEGVNLIPHCNGNDFWLVFGGHTTGINPIQNIYVYHVSSYGVSASPSFVFQAPIGSYLFRIKASPDNGHIIFNRQNGASYTINMVDFNNANGIISNLVTIHSSSNYFNAFSFNSTSDRVFFHENDPNSYLKYIEINNNNAVVNIGNNVIPVPMPNPSLFQLGPDNNIYGRFSTNVNMRIVNPNSPAPSYETNTLNVNVLPGMFNRYALPNFMDGVAPPPIPLTVNVVYTSCTDVALSVPACWDGYDYDIDWGDGTPNQQSTALPNNITHSYTSSGTYIITLTLLPPGQTTIPLNPIQITQAINILGLNTPIAGDATPCLTTTLPQVYSVPQLLNATYLWTTSANGTILGANNTHQVNVDWTLAGTGTISVTIISGACTLNLTLPVTVLQNPIASITNGSPCSMPALLTASPANMSSYAWNGPVFGSGNPFSATSNGTYTVTVTDINGCEGFASITVASMPTQIFVNPLASDILTYYNILSPNNTIAGATFGIDGILTMDADLTFQTCHIYMAPDAEIQVVNNSTIFFSDLCIVETPAQCPMWKGIFADGIGNNVIIHGSSFKDMKDGVQVRNDAGLTISGSKFYNNFKGVHLIEQSGASANITLCEFKTTNNFLKSPYNNETKGEHGIILENCSNITIGDPNNSTNKNHFENLYNGIYIRDAVALSSINTITTSLNTFKNITGGPSLIGPAGSPWGLPYNMQHRGAAIFGNSSIQTNNLWLEHYGHNNATIDFDACTKAILVNAFNTEIHNNRVASTINSINPEAGFLTYKNEGKVIYIRYNHILKTILGVNLNGTASFCDVHGNTIETNTTYDFSGFPAWFFTTSGINVSEFSSTPNQQGKYIDYNTLTINNLAAGEGINVLKTKWGRIHDNVIHFASNDPSDDNTARPSLVGLRLNRVILSHVNNNNVVLDNHANTAILQNRKTIGIELFESPSNEFDCNTNDYLHWGMQVRGDCDIMQADRFKQNFFRTYYFGIYSTNLSAQGYLGKEVGYYDINPGGYKFDANNQFVNAVNPSNKRLFRFLPNSTVNCDNAKIVTYHTKASNNTLIANLPPGIPPHSQSAGGSGGANSCIDVIDNPPFNPTEIATSCVPIQNNIMDEEEDGGAPITDNPDVEGMIDIAQDSVLYSEYPELGEWYDERRLMDMLTTHDSLRLQYPILNTFYMQRQQGNLDKLNKIDRYLGMLSDSATIANSANYAYNLQQAIQLNNEINSTEYYVQNEKWINTLYMRRWDVGNDTISETEAEAIDALASECPYVAGNAVYKARMLNAYYFPTKQYNDKVICNAVGVFKNGKGLFDDEEAYLDSIMNVQTKGMVATELIKVYPNPAQDKVTIEFEEMLLSDAQFELMDLSGRVILTKTLIQGTSSTTLKLPQIADGLYTYKIVMPKGKAYNGKLIKN